MVKIPKIVRVFMDSEHFPQTYDHVFCLGQFFEKNKNLNRHTNWTQQHEPAQLLNDWKCTFLITSGLLLKTNIQFHIPENKTRLAPTYIYPQVGNSPLKDAIVAPTWSNAYIDLAGFGLVITVTLPIVVGTSESEKIAVKSNNSVALLGRLNI